METKFIKDRFRSRRGGTSKWVLVSCLSCGAELFVYQKDGAGQILRLYLDRIVLADGSRPFKDVSINEVGPLRCINCKSVIGSPMVYEKHGEKRVAERIVNTGITIKKLSEHDLQKQSLDPIKTVKVLKI